MFDELTNALQVLPPREEALYHHQKGRREAASSVKDTGSFETYRSAEGLTHTVLWSGDVLKATTKLRTFR